MMCVSELFDILVDHEKFYSSNNSNCYYKNCNGELVPFDYVEFLADGTLIVSQTAEPEQVFDFSIDDIM